MARAPRVSARSGRTCSSTRRSLLPLPYSRLARWINRFILFREPAALDARHRLHPADRLDVPADAARARSDRRGRSDADDLLLHRRSRVELAWRRGASVRAKQQLFRDADLVFVTSEKLRAARRRVQRARAPVPVRRQLRAFEQAQRDSARRRPPTSPSLPRPIAGYVGGLHQWVDQDLIVESARRHAGRHVRAGRPGAGRRVAAERRARTSTCSGSGRTPSVPRYVQAFDVGLVPYRLSEYTANVYPTKLNEYLAMGMPVVATDLPEIRRFNREHGDIVARRRAMPRRSRARSAAELAHDARRGRRPAHRASRRRTAGERRIDRMQALIERGASASTRGAEERGTIAAAPRLPAHAQPRVSTSLARCRGDYLLLFQTPLLWWVAEPLRRSPARRRRRMPSSCLPAASASRAKPAAAIRNASSRRSTSIKAGYAPRMVFSSGFVFAFQEAEVMQALAVANGVPPDRDRARGARRQHARERRVRQADPRARTAGDAILLVSSPYHMRRALLTWRQGRARTRR